MGTVAQPDRTQQLGDNIATPFNLGHPAHGMLGVPILKCAGFSRRKATHHVLFRSVLRFPGGS